MLWETEILGKLRWASGEICGNLRVELMVTCSWD